MRNALACLPRKVSFGIVWDEVSYRPFFTVYIVLAFRSFATRLNRVARWNRH